MRTRIKTAPLIYCIWDFERVGTFFTKMNSCHTKFLLSSDMYETYFSRTQMIILCPRHTKIHYFLISFRSSFLDPHFHIFLSLRLANEKNLYHNQFVILKRKNKIQLYYSYYYYLLNTTPNHHLLKNICSRLLQSRKKKKSYRQKFIIPFENKKEQI